MLAVVEPAEAFRGSVQYNETKVKLGQARFLDAHNFLPEKEELTIRDKLKRFHDLASLNERSHKHCIHLSVNFPPKDELSDRQMKQIAAEFMQAIDFGDQPWLLYRHVDAGHPHMHIVTTNIRFDGSRISNDKRSPHYLKQTCFTLEQRHSLTPMFTMPDLFQEQKEMPAVEPEERYLKPIVYGERPTRTAIDEVLRTFNERYAFTSFEAYNALLSLFNVRADRGLEGSAMYQNKGLYYRLIDASGKKIGAPIKASDFKLPVTWERLEEKYKLSEQHIQENLRYVRIRAFSKLAGKFESYSLAIFRRDLYQEGITVVIPAWTQRNPRGWEKSVRMLSSPQNRESGKGNSKPDDGHGFFYVDWKNEMVVRDTDLGKDLTAAAFLERIGVEKALRQMQSENTLRLSTIQKAILDPNYPDKAETRRLLLRLTPEHDKIVQKMVELKEQEELQQRQSRRMRHSL